MGQGLPGALSGLLSVVPSIAFSGLPQRSAGVSGGLASVCMVFAVAGVLCGIRARVVLLAGWRLAGCVLCYQADCLRGQVLHGQALKAEL